MRVVEVKAALSQFWTGRVQAHAWEKLKVGRLESKGRSKTLTVARGLPLLEDTVKKFSLADLVADRVSLFLKS
jgi:hypothetical protein